VRLAALSLEVDLGWSRTRIGDSENLRFSLKFTGSHFHLDVTFLCKLGRIGGSG